MLNHRCVLVAAAVVLGAAVARGQVADGTLAVVSLTEFQYSLVDPQSGVDTPFSLTNTTGSGTANTQCVLWDPAQPDSFLIGGEGFLGRVTITAGVSNYALITNQIGIASQLSFDANGQIVLIDSTADQVLRVDPNNGGISAITTGMQPWGADANCGAIDPATGDIYVGGNNAMWVIRNGTNSATLLSSGWTTGGFAFSTGVVFHPLTGEMVVSILTLDRIVQMDKLTGAIVDLVPAHSIQSCNSVAFEANGDLVVAGWMNALWRIPAGGGTPVNFGQLPNQGLLATGIAVKTGACGGSALAYGQGCPGTGDIVPVLSLDGCPEVGETVQLTVQQGLGGSTAIVLLGLVPGSTPVGPGCALLVFPVIGAQIALPLGGAAGVAGAGSIAVPLVLPPIAAGSAFTMQAFVIDPAKPLGASGTQGVSVVIP